MSQRANSKPRLTGRITFIEATPLNIEWYFFVRLHTKAQDLAGYSPASNRLSTLWSKETLKAASGADGRALAVRASGQSEQKQ